MDIHLDELHMDIGLGELVQGQRLPLLPSLPERKKKEHVQMPEKHGEEQMEILEHNKWEH